MSPKDDLARILGDCWRQTKSSPTFVMSRSEAWALVDVLRKERGDEAADKWAATMRDLEAEETAT